MSWPYKERKEVRNVSGLKIWHSESQQLIPIFSQLLRLQGRSSSKFLNYLEATPISMGASTLWEQESYQALTPRNEAHPAFSIWGVKEVPSSCITTRHLAHPCFLVSINLLTSRPISSFRVGKSLLWSHASPVQLGYSLPHRCHLGKRWTLCLLPGMQRELSMPTGSVPHYSHRQPKQHEHEQ